MIHNPANVVAAASPLGYEAPWLVGGHVPIHDDHDRSPSVGHMGGSSRSGGFDPILECVSCFGPSLVMVRNRQHDMNIYVPCLGWIALDGAVIAGAAVVRTHLAGLAR
jgi:hypothetical protein